MINCFLKCSVYECFRKRNILSKNIYILHLKMRGTLVTTYKNEKTTCHYNERLSIDNL